MIKKIQNKLNNDANLKELLSGSAITFIMRIGGMGIGYLTILIIARKYGAEGTGIYGLTNKLINFLAIIGTLGMNVSILRYAGQYGQIKGSLKMLNNLYKNILNFIIPFSFLLSIFLFLFSNDIAISMFENEMYSPALKLSAIALPFYTINLIDIEYIRGLKKIKISEFFRSVSRQLIILILISFVIFNYKILDPVIALVIGTVCTSIISISYLYILFKKSKKQFNLIDDISKKKLLKVSLPMMITTVSYFYFANSGVLFLEIFTSTNEVGVFNVCFQLAALVSIILNAVNTISAPKFSELYWQNKHKELQQVIDHSNRIVFFASISTSILIITLSNWILNIYGTEYLTGKGPLIILILGQLINSLAGGTGTIMNMCGFQVEIRNITLITAIVSSILFLILTPEYGIIGVCIVISISQIIYNLSSSLYILKKAKIRTYYNPFIKIKNDQI